MGGKQAGRQGESEECITMKLSSALNNLSIKFRNPISFSFSLSDPGWEGQPGDEPPADDLGQREPVWGDEAGGVGDGGRPEQASHRLQRVGHVQGEADAGRKPDQRIDAEMHQARGSVCPVMIG